MLDITNLKFSANDKSSIVEQQNEITLTENYSTAPPSASRILQRNESTIPWLPPFTQISTQSTQEALNTEILRIKSCIMGQQHEITLTEKTPQPSASITDSKNSTATDDGGNGSNEYDTYLEEINKLKKRLAEIKAQRTDVGRKCKKLEHEVLRLKLYIVDL